MAVDAVKPAGEQWAPIATIGLLFFIIGFVTWLNGPLISFVQLAFTLNEVNAFLVPMVFYISYLVLALPASAILRRIGMKKGLVLALLVMAVGTYLFGLFVLGAGLSLLQTSINPYISMIGPIEGAARRIALMGICNKFAGLLAPIVLGALVLRDMGGIADRVANAASPEARDAVLAGFAHSVFLPYLGMSALLVLAAAGIALSSLPDIDPGKSNAGGNAVSATRWPTAPNLWFGILCLFLYVGAEVMAGDAIGTYGRGFHLPLDQTKFFTSFTLAAMVVGYVVGFLLTPRFVSQERYLAGSAALGIVLTTCAALTHGYVSVLCVAALGFANAMMWPAIFPLAIRGLGVATETGSALLIMGICGGAVIPQIFVHLKQHFDFQIVFWCVMAPIYGYILFYGLIGARSIVAARTTVRA